jgi:hypothetical protein
MTIDISESYLLVDLGRCEDTTRTVIAGGYVFSETVAVTADGAELIYPPASTAS